MRKIKKSFYNWCMENNRQDLLDRWDSKLNQISPNNVSYGTKLKYYFKCPIGMHDSESNSIYGIVSGNNLITKCKQCNSFGQWGIDHIDKNFIDKYWDFNKNTSNPWRVQRGSRDKVYLLCQDKPYHDSYLITPLAFTCGNRCPYCSGKKINSKDSFAQYHIDNTDKNFLEKYWGSKNTINPFEISISNDNKVWMVCQEVLYHEEYLVRCADFTKGKRCSYCRGDLLHLYDSLGHIRKESVELWSNINDKSPYDYRLNSHFNAVWVCENEIHDDYKRSIYHAQELDFRCPMCVKERKESFLQEKVRNYLHKELGYKLKHEYNCSIIPINPNTNKKMPFDNEIVNLSLICEVNGKQHELLESHKAIFKHPNMTPEESLMYQKWRDEYKKQYALDKGFSYLEIPYTADDKAETYKTLINNKISEIKSKQEIPNPSFLQEAVS